jgi:hypothetical protein
MNLKNFINEIKKNPTEFTLDIIVLITLGLVFYVAMWIFY